MRMLIVSGKKDLGKQIGDTRHVETWIRKFMDSKSRYETKFLYYDEKTTMSGQPAKNFAPSIRNFIERVEKRWGSIDFLLLLGGDEVIPFFRLPNPCDDGDEHVLSDSPYASRDEDYVIPERVCGRIPDNHSAEFIVRQLKKYCTMTGKAFGITAKVWRKASELVYEQIGNPKELKTSPPVTLQSFKSEWLQNRDFLYFNLHGSNDSPHWYGQGNGDYPIALAPDTIHYASGIVATEACYGAYILDKSDRDAICLKFLSEEHICGFCGSTTIAYGPPSPPSSEADLLVKYFFEYAKQGITLGESLKNAKLDFARKALRRKGFLDDDDTKTLLQYVLYGDPTFRLAAGKARSV